MQFVSKKNLMWIAALTLLLSALWIGYSSGLAGASPSDDIPAPQAGFLAPDFTLSTPDGVSYTLSDLRGKPVLINLWASWCGPCRAEMPAMQALYEKFHQDGFEILAVNATNQDTVPAAEAFVAEYGLTFPILLDHDGAVSSLYQLRALPSSFFISKDGTISEVVIGGPMAEALLITRVEKLLSESP